MVNGNSLILCQPNTRTFEFIKALIQLRIANCNDKNINEMLINILLDDDLDETRIFKELFDLFEEIDVENEIITLIENTACSKKSLLSKIKNKVDSLNPNKSENVEEIQKNLIVEKLKESKLREILENEKRIVLIADNYAVHRARLVKEACIVLNIKIVLLPTNSPQLNPIEQVWKSIKKFMSHFYLDNLEQMKQLFTEEFYRIVDNKSFFSNWLIKFIDDFNC